MINLKGHQIGSHTFSHRSLAHNMTSKEIVDDIRRLENTVFNILGLKMTVFRPPYGNSSNELRNLISHVFGYREIAWSLDTQDWFFRENVDMSFMRYESTLGSEQGLNNSYIVLHHDPLPGSGELARKSIRYLRAKGYRLARST